jgi:hypothetical protein
MLKSGITEDGVKVSFDVNYAYSPDKKASDLKYGENLLTFTKDPNTNEDRSDVSATEEINGDLVIFYTGNTGVIKEQGKSSKTVLHETLHFLGLSDRYDEYNNNLTGMLNQTVPQRGFQNDIMSNGTSFNPYYYELYKNFAEKISTVYYMHAIPINTRVDLNKEVSLLTPYESGEVHTNHNVK